MNSQRMRVVIFVLASGVLGAGLFAAHAEEELEGAVSGGGGKVVVCRKADRSIQSVELLDLWEARELYQLPAKKLKGSLQLNVMATIERLKNTLPYDGSGDAGEGRREGQDFILSLQRVLAKRFLQPDAKVVRKRGVVLQDTPDAMEVAWPAGNCRVEQIVNYQPGGRILINQDLYDHLDLTNQTALIAHEALYAVLREMAGETNSVRTRRAVGFVMAGNAFAAIEKPALPDETLVCAGEPEPFQPKTQVRIFPGHRDGDRQGINIYIERVGGTELIGRKKLLHQAGFWDGAADIVLGRKPCAENSFAFRLGLELDGPVEADRAVHISWVCHQGQFRMLLNQNAPGLREIETYPLTCQLQPIRNR